MIQYLFLILYSISLVHGETYTSSNYSFSLSCPEGDVLNIASAYFANENVTSCNQTTSPNCSVVDLSRLIARRCDFWENCSVTIINSASNDTKYWTVDYTCVNASNITFPSKRCHRFEHFSPVVCECSNQCPSSDFDCANTCSSNGGCVCNVGFRRDPITGICVQHDYCPLGRNLNETHEEFSQCANRQNHCRRGFGFGDGLFSIFGRCVPGYVCRDGYVRDEYTGTCVPPGECVRTWNFPRAG